MDSEFFDGEAEIGGVNIPILAGGMEDPKELIKNLIEALKDEAPLDRSRPYQSQQPKRAQVFVEGLTMRDIHDCMVRGFLLSGSHINPEGYQKAQDNTCCHDDLYGHWDLDQLDPGAIIQNTQCEIEKMMGIYPNMLDFD